MAAARTLGRRPASARLSARRAAAGGSATGIAAGVLLGGLLGGATGSVLDDRDKRTATNTTQQALESKPSGSTTTWRNPDTGNSGSVTPVRTFQANNGQYCREYEQSVTIGGKPQKSYGTACRQPDEICRPLCAADGDCAAQCLSDNSGAPARPARPA